MTTPRHGIDVLVVVGVDGLDGESPWYAKKIRKSTAMKEQLQTSGGQWVEFEWQRGSRLEEFVAALASRQYAVCLFADLMHLGSENYDHDGGDDNDSSDDSSDDSSGDERAAAHDDHRGDDEHHDDGHDDDDEEDERMFVSLSTAPVSEALQSFTRDDGGTVVFCGGGVTDVVLPVVRRVFGLSHWANGSFGGGTYAATEAAQQWLGQQAPAAFYAGSVSVRGTRDDEQLYTETTSESREVLAAAAGIGSGRVVFVGDVNGEEATTQLVAAVYARAVAARSAATTTHEKPPR